MLVSLSMLTIIEHLLTVSALEVESIERRSVFFPSIMISVLGFICIYLPQTSDLESD